MCQANNVQLEHNNSLLTLSHETAYTTSVQYNLYVHISNTIYADTAAKILNHYTIILF